MPSPYVGRFAPSPTGPLHAGSLLAAVASYLDARASGGRWLLRIEDVDRHRTVRGARDSILRSLEAHGLLWDGEIALQSERDGLYEAALQQLVAADRIFYCDCSRKQLRQHGGPYPGFCRDRRQVNYREASAEQPASHAIRLDVSDRPDIVFDDRILGPQQFELASLGDFIVRRRDSLFAYQLAVVVDDQQQGITDVVRGVDLLDSTPWQIELQRALGYRRPRYAHLPVLVHADGSKLSKQTGSKALDDRNASANLVTSLRRLGQCGADIEYDGSLAPAALLDRARAQWSLSRVPTRAIQVRV